MLCYFKVRKLILSIEVKALKLSMFILDIKRQLQKAAENTTIPFSGSGKYQQRSGNKLQLTICRNRPLLLYSMSKKVLIRLS